MKHSQKILKKLTADKNFSANYHYFDNQSNIKHSF